MQGPEVFLNNLGLSVNCVVNIKEKAQIDEKHRVFVNWETYYLSNNQALKKFKKSAYEYTGKLTDPVNQSRFQPTKESPARIIDGRYFYFQNQENALAFDDDPEGFITPVVGMKKM